MSAQYVKGTQNHLDIEYDEAVVSGKVADADQCSNLVAVFTRPYAANAKAAAAYTGVFRFTTAVGPFAVGDPVSVHATSGDVIAPAANVRTGVVTRATASAGDPVEVAINVSGVYAIS